MKVDAATVAASPVRGRVVFVLAAHQTSAEPLLRALRSLPGVAVPERPPGLVAALLDRVVLDNLALGGSQAGIGGLAPADVVLAATRHLADTVYEAGLRKHGGRVIIDASPANATRPDAIPLVYPDAHLVRVVDDPVEVVARDLPAGLRGRASAGSNARRWAAAERTLDLLSASTPLVTIDARALRRDPGPLLADLAAAVGIDAPTEAIEHAALVIGPPARPATGAVLAASVAFRALRTPRRRRAAGSPAIAVGQVATPHPAGPGPLAGISPLAVPLVLIVGCHRSGTTWLERLLLAHPAVGSCGLESAVFWSLELLADSGRAGPIADCIPPDELGAAMRRFCDTLFGAALRDHAPTASIFLERTPTHGELLGMVRWLYPDVSVIAIHRDGRDVARSIREVHYGTDDLAEAAAWWSRINGRIAQEAANIGRFRWVSYEQLYTTPVPEVEGILSWMGLAVDATVRAEIERQAPVRVSKFNTSGDVGPQKWRSLSGNDLFTIYAEAGPGLVHLGYVTPSELRAFRRRPAYALYAARSAARTARRRARSAWSSATAKLGLRATAP